MRNHITASVEDLLKQAPMTAHTYMREGIKSIDEAFGEGFSMKNPALLSAFMQASAADFNNSIIAKSLQDGLVSISEALHALDKK